MIIYIGMGENWVPQILDGKNTNNRHSNLWSPGSYEF